MKTIALTALLLLTSCTDWWPSRSPGLRGSEKRVLAKSSPCYTNKGNALRLAGTHTTCHLGGKTAEGADVDLSYECEPSEHIACWLSPDFEGDKLCFSAQCEPGTGE